MVGGSVEGRGSPTRGIFTGDRLEHAGQAFLFGLFGFLFLSTAGIMFIAGAVLLMMRIVKLLLLMIASAPALAAYILPNTRGYFNTWLETLLREAFFAPVLLLLFAISLLFLNTARNTFVQNDASFAAIFINGNIDSVNLVIIFLIALGFLFMSIKVAQDMGVSGAKAAMGVQKWAQGMAGRATIGAGSAGLRAGNRFVQRNLRAADEEVSESLKPDKTSSRGQRILRGALRTGYGAVRTVGGAAARGVDIGIDDLAKQGTSNTFGSRYSVDSLKERTTKRDAELDAANNKERKEQNLKNAEGLTQNPGESDDDFKLRKDAAIQLALQEFKDAELAELKATRLATEAIAENLTPANFKKLLESDKLSDADKEAVAETRFKPLNDAIATGSADQVNKVVQNYSKDELDVLSVDTLTEDVVAQNLKESQFEELKKSNSLTSAQKKIIGDKRTEVIKSAIAKNDVPKIQEFLKSKKAVTKLKRDELVNTNLIAQLTPNHLKALADSDDVGPSVLREIGAEIKRDRTLNGPAYRYIDSSPIRSFFW